MNGSSSQKTISKASPVSISYNILEIILLSSIGAMGVLMHAYLRFPMNIPGHMGLVYMAILFTGRLISKKPYASSLSSIGAAFMLLFPLGFHDPFLPLIYFIPGLVVDIAYKYSGKMVVKILFAGIAYAMIPLVRLLITTTTGFVYGSIVKHGFVVPVISHFAFAFAGAAIALSAVLFFRKSIK